jgi:hypothetical protein
MFPVNTFFQATQNTNSCSCIPHEGAAGPDGVNRTQVRTKVAARKSAGGQTSHNWHYSTASTWQVVPVLLESRVCVKAE